MLDLLTLFAFFPTVCNGEVEQTTNSRLADGAQDENGGNIQGGEALAINRATLKLDWVFGDDPSQVAIPGSPPAKNDTPAFDIPSTVQEAPEFSLGTTLEEVEAPPRKSPRRKSIMGTWPRMRRLFDSSETGGRNTSIESFMSGSSSNGLDSGMFKSSNETLESNLARISKRTATQGTQTECSMMDQATVLKGRVNRLVQVVSFLCERLG